MKIMINNISYIRFNQGINTFYMLSVSIDKLLNNYEIDLYDEIRNPNGYQRPIQKSHRRKIVEYLINEKEPILNTAILAAIDRSNIKEEGGYITIKDKFKIVDGQHRIEAFKELKETYFDIFNSKFTKYEVPIILMITNEGKIMEMETFVNINNKNKRVNTALAEHILEEIRKKKKPEFYAVINWNKMDKNERQDFINSIGSRVTKQLNDDSNTLWFKLIKTGDSNTKDRVISINAFNSSLKPLIENYIKYNLTDENEINPDQLVNDIFEMITYIWENIKNKWVKAFDIKYYNIQKGIGVYTIHSIFAQCIEKFPEDFNQNFDRIIENSEVESKDWCIGGKFSPLNSKSGMKEIEKYILNNQRK